MSYENAWAPLWSTCRRSAAQSPWPQGQARREMGEYAERGCALTRASLLASDANAAHSRSKDHRVRHGTELGKPL